MPIVLHSAVTSIISLSWEDGREADLAGFRVWRKAPAEEEDRKQEALDLALETVEALVAERGAGEPIWGSMVKQALKRRKPGFSESYYGFKSFSDLLEEAGKRKLLALERDEKSGGYIVRVVAS